MEAADAQKDRHGQTWSRTWEHGKDSDGHRTSKLKITYAYHVNGDKFTAHRIASGTSSGSMNRYRPGAIQVFYDPDDPATAVLEPGVTFGVIAIMFMGCFQVSAGAGFAIWVLAYFRIDGRSLKSRTYPAVVGALVLMWGFSAYEAS